MIVRIRGIMTVATVRGVDVSEGYFGVLAKAGASAFVEERTGALCTERSSLQH